MANEEHLNILKRGVATWNDWRDKNPETIPALQNADLSEADLKNVNLEKANLRAACLRGADLTSANLTESKLHDAYVDRAFLVDANLGNAYLARASLSGASLSGANLAGANLAEARLSMALLLGANLREANLRRTDIGGADLDKANLREAKLCEANLDGSNLRGANLFKADCSEANLAGTNLRQALLRDANLRDSNLQNADLTAAIVDEETQLRGADVDGCKIDRYALECLSDYGGLTVGQRMALNINDDVADLRASYSGLRLWGHVIALVIFSMPYLWFICVRAIEASFFSDSSQVTISLLHALCRFVWNGGYGWREGFADSPHWSFWIFILLLAYNGIRGSLLWKTNQLERNQITSGLPVRFSLANEPIWGRLVGLIPWLFWFGTVILTLNTWNFLSQQVPIGS